MKRDVLLNQAEALALMQVRDNVAMTDAEYENLQTHPDKEAIEKLAQKFLRDGANELCQTTH